MAKDLQVMIVDPDLESRADVHKVAARVHFPVVVEAGYGREALSLARERTPDVILVGVDQGVDRALETVEGLAGLLPNTPVILYSDGLDAVTFRRAMQLGVRDYLPTPVKEEELTRSIHAVLEQEERRRVGLSGDGKERLALGTVITIFGPKGGIGKTTIATNLAAALALEASQSVALVDLDTHFGDVGIMMEVRAQKSIANVASLADGLDRELLRDHLFAHESGVMILPAPSRPNEWTTLGGAQVQQVIKLLAQMHDYVILDLPGTFNEIVTAALEAASVILLVTSADLASIKDTLLVLEVLGSAPLPPKEIKLIMNHVSAQDGVREREVEQALEQPIFWTIPYDPRVSKTTGSSQPAVVGQPQGRASRSITDLAFAISGIQKRRPGPDRLAGGLVSALFSARRDRSTSP